MKRLMFIVEGDSEQAFVKKILVPYLNSKGILDISVSKIKASKGGISKYSQLKVDLENCVHQTNVLVTTFIDFYALPEDFPRYKESQQIAIIAERIDFLEKAINEDVSVNNSILIPYIQMHEFEALIFSSSAGLEKYYDSNQANFKVFESILKEFPNPEDINNSKDTAPSKRMRKVIKGYNKVNDGITIIEEIGLDTIRLKCPRFNSWLDKIVTIYHT